MSSVDTPLGAVTLENLRNAFRAGAMLDAIVQPETEYRCFFYESKWIEDVDLARLDDGEGNNMFGIFAGTHEGILKGFCHESEGRATSTDFSSKTIDALSLLLRKTLTALESDQSFPPFSTFLFWQTKSAASWKRAEGGELEHDDACFRELSALIPWDAQKYALWASEYYGCAFPASGIEAIYNNAALSPSLLELFEQSHRMTAIYAEAEIIGWPRE